MRFGACIPFQVENIAIAKDCGYDYVECDFGIFSKEKSDVYDKYKAEIERCGIPCEASNRFLPATLKSTGNDVDFDKIREYIDYGMKKAKEIGVKTVIFGSGPSRQVPEGFCFGKAVNQLVDLLETVVSPVAEKYGLTVVIEPLCDCNIVSTVKEGAMIAALSGKDNIGGLSDLYHMYKMNDSNDNIKQCEGIIKHAHIAEPTKRVYPADVNEYDYKSYVQALEAVGCERCSVEAGTENFDIDAHNAIKVLRAL